MVERNLAKVEVESSRLFSRSKLKGQHFKMLSFFLRVLSCTEGGMRRGSKAVMQWIANPSRAVRLRPAPPSSINTKACPGNGAGFLLGFGKHRYTARCIAVSPKIVWG